MHLPPKANSRLVPSIKHALSNERFQTYADWARGDEELALRIYSFNVQLSAILYGPLHMLEVTLRNVSDQQLIQKYGLGWLISPGVLKSTYQQACVIQAMKSIRRQGKGASHSSIISELTFGFWTSLFSKDSHHLWNTLRPIFVAGGIQRSKITSQLLELRRLRNRIAHYEPILTMPLAQCFAEILALTEMLSFMAYEWTRQNSDWQNIFPATPILILDPVSGKKILAHSAEGYLPVMKGII